MTYARLTARLCLAALALLAAGCAIQQDRSGRLKFEVDEAELIGRTLQTFRLPDGSEARLRESNGRITLKLQKQMTVIPIEDAVLAEVRSVATAGGRTLIVVTKSRPGCVYNTQLLAIQGREVLTWDFGDCFHAPTMQVAGDTATFDHQQDNGVTLRFIYQNGRMGRTSFRGQPPQPGSPAAAAADPASAVVPPGSPRYRPGLPAEPVRSERPASTDTAPRSTPASAAPARPAAPPRPASPAPAKPLDFPAQEMKPVRIILDK